MNEAMDKDKRIIGLSMNDATRKVYDPNGKYLFLAPPDMISWSIGADSDGQFKTCALDDKEKMKQKEIELAKELADSIHPENIQVLFKLLDYGLSAKEIIQMKREGLL